ncbi:MAG: pseudaminic acid synthase [candidate division WOR-3 bacterium]
MPAHITINGHAIGAGQPVYTVAELSANHNQSFEQAVRLVQAAKEAGADAVKLQTYTPDTLTIDCHNEYFRIKGTAWDGKNLYDLYREAYTPWEWQPKLKEVAEKLGLSLFSSPFDDTAVDFLEKINVPAYKIASFELVDTGLLRKVAATGKPIILSTGMATFAEIEEAVATIRQAGCSQLALLKCNSGYPAPPEEMNLRTIPHMAETFGAPVGLSDHTMEVTVPVAAVALGACIIEKHFTLTRATPGPDSTFSLEPHEFKAMVDAIRTTEKALGQVRYGVTEHEAVARSYRRSLFAVEDIHAGEIFTNKNVRSIRPGYGLAPKYLPEVLGRRAVRDIARGTPLSRDMVA